MGHEQITFTKLLCLVVIAYIVATFFYKVHLEMLLSTLYKIIFISY